MVIAIIIIINAIMIHNTMCCINASYQLPFYLASPSQSVLTSAIAFIFGFTVKISVDIIMAIAAFSHKMTCTYLQHIWKLSHRLWASI
jgi:hypothetical protein